MALQHEAELLQQQLTKIILLENEDLEEKLKSGTDRTADAG